MNVELQNVLFILRKKKIFTAIAAQISSKKRLKSRRRFIKELLFKKKNVLFKINKIFSN